MIDYYTINENTCALIPINEYKTRVYELKNRFDINVNIMTILNDSCLKFGSSYAGRAASTKYAIGYTHKAPICINEFTLNIFFPTKSPRLIDCAWICYKNVYIYSKNGKDCAITFKNDVTITVNASYTTIQNQIFRSSRLEYYLKNTFPQIGLKRKTQL